MSSTGSGDIRARRVASKLLDEALDNDVLLSSRSAAAGATSVALLIGMHCPQQAASEQCGPMSCRPIGRPVAVKPIGKVTAGRPAALIGEVNFMSLYISPSIRLSISDQLGVPFMKTGIRIASTLPNIRAIRPLNLSRSIMPRPMSRGLAARPASIPSRVHLP